MGLGITGNYNTGLAAGASVAKRVGAPTGAEGWRFELMGSASSAPNGARRISKGGHWTLRGNGTTDCG